jgi:hypothetical protein
VSYGLNWFMFSKAMANVRMINTVDAFLPDLMNMLASGC